MSQEVISQLLAAVLNFSDLNDLFSLACDEAGMVPLLVDVTRELQDSIPHNVKYVVGILELNVFNNKYLFTLTHSMFQNAKLNIAMVKSHVSLESRPTPFGRSLTWFLSVA